jgi:predicted AlkP superfamily pyrophosphatase or phosphodiesterase
MRRALCASVALAAMVVNVAGQAPAARHVILITIDGLRGDYLAATDPYQLKIPTLRALMRDGSSSDRTISVFPTLTGTAHTTLVTGVAAARHGILGNNRFDPSVWTWGRENYDVQPPYQEFSHVKAPTLWSAVRARGGTTAAISWPQTAGGPIDHITDIIPARPADTILGPVTPANVRMADHFKALIAAETLLKMQPAFMAVHFTQTDAVQHALGPGTPEALVALEDTDTNIGVLVDAVRRAGMTADVTFVVTGDHGFLPFHTELAMNLPLVEAGLITKGPDGHAQWQAMIAPNRGLGSLYVNRGADRAAVIAKAREVLTQYERRFPGRFRIVERDELDRLGADADAAFGIEPVRGYVLDGRLSPPFAQAHNRAAGHGYSPATPGMETGLILAGAGVRPGVRLPETRTLDVAPTIAVLLGLELRQAEGQPIAGALK